MVLVVDGGPESFVNQMDARRKIKQDANLGDYNPGGFANNGDGQKVFGRTPGPPL